MNSDRDRDRETRLGRLLAPVLRRPLLALDAWAMKPRGIYALTAEPGLCGCVRNGRLCGQPAGPGTGDGADGFCAGHQQEFYEAVELVESHLRRLRDRAAGPDAKENCDA